MAKRILICPLNWGLGHATRCIPVIHELARQGATVFIAGSGNSLSLLKYEFPALTCLTFTEKEITYPANGNMVWHIIKSFPGLIKNIFNEHQQLKKFIKEYSIDIVISDNRYGCWNKNSHSIFITHQLNIQSQKGLKFLQPIINSINHFFIRRYNECWVPDEKELPGLSGILSHGDYYLKQVHYIQPLSRFEETAETSSEKTYDLLVILSGPEPQRSIFEKMIIKQIVKDNLQTLIVRGVSANTPLPESISNVTFTNHLESPLLKFHLQHSKYILCRPGYSSIMDLAFIGRKAIVVPTPGQTEQEYLAGFYHLQKKHFMQIQNQFDLLLALKGIEFCEPFHYKPVKNLLKENINRILNLKPISLQKEQ